MQFDTLFDVGKVPLLHLQDNLGKEAGVDARQRRKDQGEEGIGKD